MVFIKLKLLKKCLLAYRQRLVDRVLELVEEVARAGLAVQVGVVEVAQVVGLVGQVRVVGRLGEVVRAGVVEEVAESW